MRGPRKREQSSDRPRSDPDQRSRAAIRRDEAAGIAQLYDGDVEFREHVNRYIHDFEALLRRVLASRDGGALAMTVLSSDMGKLYVALAQAIERLLI